MNRLPSRRPRATRVLAILLMLAGSLCASAETARKVGWADLQPDDPALRSELKSLAPPLQKRVAMAVEQRTTQQMLANMKMDPQDYTQGERQILKQDFSDVAKLVDRVEAFEKRRSAEVITALDRQLVQIHGYVLPLTRDRRNVTEFLLVPLVGACIHVPPPPPNQIIFVRFPQGYPHPPMFSPMVVTGHLSVKAAKANLFLVDGSSDIDYGYSMDAQAIAPESAPLP